MTIHLEDIINSFKEIQCYACNSKLELKKSNIYDVRVLCECKLFYFLINKRTYNEYYIQPICYDDNDMLLYGSIIYINTSTSKFTFYESRVFQFTEETCNLEFNNYIKYNNLEDFKDNIHSALVTFCRCKNNLIFR